MQHFFQFSKFPNGSIFHKRHKILYEEFEYELFHVEARHQETVFRVCSKLTKKPTKVMVVIGIINGIVGRTFAWISVICLSVHIFIYTAIKKLRTPSAQNLLALTCALCPGQFLFALGLTYQTSHSLCVLIATCLHYLYLVASFWMNVLHFDLCRVCFKRSVLKKVSSSAREATRAKFRFKLYSYYAWGFPILLVSGGHLSDYLQPLKDYSPEYAKNFCWINSQAGLAMFFALPMATLLLENAIFIGISVICLLQNHRQVFIQSKLILMPITAAYISNGAALKFPIFPLNFGLQGSIQVNLHDRVHETVAACPAEDVGRSACSPLPNRPPSPAGQASTFSCTGSCN